MLKQVFSVTNDGTGDYKVITILGKSFLVKRYLMRLKLFLIKKDFPRTISIEETLKYIKDNKCSISRFGDGECYLLCGEGLGEHYQEYDDVLSKRLKEIISKPTENCLVGVVPPNNLGCYWRNFFSKYYKIYRKYLNKNVIYAHACISRTNVFTERNVEVLKSIWEQRKVLFVVGSGSRFVYEDRLFSNCSQSDMLVVKGKSSFSEYEDILSKIKEYDNSWLIFLSLGPTATVLAYDLSKLGYQALDLGHLPNCYRMWKGEAVSPEKLTSFFEKEEGIYHIK